MISRPYKYSYASNPRYIEMDPRTYGGSSTPGLDKIWQAIIMFFASILHTLGIGR